MSIEKEFSWGVIKVLRIANMCEVRFKVTEPDKITNDEIIVEVYDDGTVKILREKLVLETLFKYEPEKGE